MSNAALLAEPTTQYRYLRADVHDQGKGVVVGVINSIEVDAHNTVVIPKGCDYSHYMKSNRTVNWEHGFDNRGRIPVAKMKSIRVTDREITGTMQFGTDPFSQSVYHSYKDGITKGFSIEFNEKKAVSGPPTKHEIEAHPEWKNVTTIYRSWKLFGVAATPEPSNPATLAIEVRSKLPYGLDEQSLIEAIKNEALDDRGVLDPERLGRALRKFTPELTASAFRMWTSCRHRSIDPWSGY